MNESTQVNADIEESKIVESELVEKQFENLVGLVEGIISYYERTYGDLPDEDCGCEEQEPTPWTFITLCILLYPLVLLVCSINIVIGFILHIPVFYELINKLNDIGIALNCGWAWSGWPLIQ